MRKKPFRGYCQSGCGKEVFSRSQSAKYCSAACAKLRFPARGKCAHCAAALATHQYKYCSLACLQQHYFQMRSAELESGKYLTNTCNRFIRRYLVQKLGERCTRCGWNERHPRTGKVPVEVEHIDGDYKNNHPSNLTLLCPNCHSLTDTYRALNRGRGRPYRLGGRENPLS